MSLCPKGKIEFNDLKQTYSLTDALALESDVYFLASVTDTSKRNGDSDVIFKNYFVLDFDVRENTKKATGELLDDDVLDLCQQVIVEKLEEGWYGDWKYCVFTGNGYHFYYIGKWGTYSPEDYSLFTMSHYNKVNGIFTDDTWHVDVSCKNIGRILRLPGTNNYKRIAKYGMALAECKIIEERDMLTDKFDTFYEVVDKEKQEKVVKEAAYWIKKSMFGNSENVIDQILDINIFDLIYEFNGIQPMSDMRNLKSPTDWSRIWAFIDANNLYITWTHHFSDVHDWYNPFTFVKVHYKLDNAGTYEWFKDKYPHIKELEIQKERQESVSDYLDYFMPYGKLLEQAAKMRQARKFDDVCKYGIKWLDDYIWGIEDNELVVIGAQTGVWKSELAYNIATTNAERGKKIMLFTLEWSIEEPAMRQLQREVGKKMDIRPVEYRFNTKNINKIEDEAIRWISEATKNNLYVFKKEQIPTLKLLRELIIKGSKDMDLIIIDHLHYIHLEKDNENKELWEIMRELKTMTDIIKKPVILVSHTKKPPTNVPDYRPTEYDLYWSSNVAKEATTIVMISKCDLWWTRTLSDMSSSRYGWTRFSVVKSRPLGNKKLIVNGAYDFYKKCYVDSERFLDDESTVEASENIFWDK